MEQALSSLFDRIIMVIVTVAFSLIFISEATSAPKKEIVIVGGDRDYPPYEFINSSGQPDGFNVELTRAIAEVMGLQADFRLGGWSDMRSALQNGQVKLLEGMSFSEERARDTSKLIIDRFLFDKHLQHVLLSTVENSSVAIFGPDSTTAAYFVATHSNVILFSCAIDRPRQA